MKRGPRHSLMSSPQQTVTPARARRGLAPASGGSAVPLGTWSQMQVAFRRLRASGRLPDSQASIKGRRAGARGNAAQSRNRRPLSVFDEEDQA